MFIFQATPEFEKLLSEIVSKAVQNTLHELTEKQNENPISAKELRQKLGISKATELRYQRLGYLKPHNFGRRVYYFWNEVVEALKSYSPELLPPSLRKKR